MPPPRGELQAAAAAAVLQLHVVAREQYTWNTQQYDAIFGFEIFGR